MDPSKDITHCKENIQPLRYGRNASQLGAALRAQEDTTAQELLLQEKQIYEDAIKNYEGDDPLENWFEYILWAEQSFPKSGHEFHVGKLLQQCLAIFEKETEYNQDRRYVRLWINYISMQKNPVELYQLIYNNGIGTVVSDLYRAWAFELEQIDDYKQADKIYLMGLNALAEPQDELQKAHENFQMAALRKTLGRTEVRCESRIYEERQAFSSLRAIKSGKRVSNVRTGHRVREHFPGTVSQMSGAMHNPKANSKIQIYQDDMPTEMKCASILDHVPVEDTVHKENTIKAGPWNSGAKRCPLMSSLMKSAFKVHEDQLDKSDTEKVRLYPNHIMFFDGSKYPEYTMVPVFVPDMPNPNVTCKTHYPKNLVYSNNMDLSMEEILALKYLKRKEQGDASSMEQQNLQNPLRDDRIHALIDVKEDTEHLEADRMRSQHLETERLGVQGLEAERIEFQRQEAERIEAQRREAKRIEAQRHEAERMEAERRELERIEAQRREVEEMEAQRREAERIEAQRREAAERMEAQRREAAERLEAQRREAAERMEAQRREAEMMEAQRREAERMEAERRKAEMLEAQRRQAERLEAQRREAERIEAQRRDAETLEAQRLEAERIEAQRIEAERLEAQRMEAELNSQQKLHSSNFMHQHHTSPLSAEAVDTLLGQSLTVNSKEALSLVQCMWQSPMAFHNTPAIRPSIPSRIPDSRAKLSFDIHLDSSMTQDVISTNKHAAPSTRMPPQGFPEYNVTPYNDQENRQSYSVAHESYSSQDHHSPYRNTSLHNSYQYQMPQHHEPQMQPRLSRPHHPQHQLLQSPQLSHHHQSLQHMPHMQPHNQSHPHSPTIPSSPINVYTQSPSRHLSNVHQTLPHGHQTHTHSPHQQHQSHQPHQQHQQQHHQQQQQHQQQPQQHSTHQHMQNMQHSVYGNMLRNDISYQPYPPSLESSMLQQNVDAQKHLSYQAYQEPQIETSKPYRMPPELPYIKSPGMNRRDLEYLEGAENKENSVVVDYNGPMEDSMAKPPDENNFNDESLGINTLPSNNDTCYTEAFGSQLSSSTPMSNTFRQPYKMREPPPYANQCVTPPVLQRIHEVPSAEPEDKLSVILETTREYISSSSNNSTHTSTRTGLGFTITRDDLVQIEEESISQIGEEKPNETLIALNQTREQMLHSQIQAVHAQSPRTVQRNVDQITSDIKTNCDLRKSISFRLNELESPEKNDARMECEENEPMEQSKEEEEEETVFQIPSRDINPFDKNLLAGLLRNLKFPQPHHAEGYVRLNLNLNKIVPSTVVTLGNEVYDIEKCLGKGMYGTVFKAINVHNGETLALKTQRPAWVWEYYITREIKARLTNPHMLRGFMNVSTAYIADNCSVLVSKFSKYGTLLSVTNQIKLSTGKPLTEHLALFFTIEILQIVEYLHKCKIIHADIKPDNFLLMQLPTEDVRPTLQLIDFGCSIDMQLFPENTTFIQVIKTEDFTCIEMRTGRPWTYQTDLYCLAATCHCLLFGNYMRVVNTGGRWFISSKIPRYVKKAAWEQFFTELLNIESCENLPDLAKLRNVMEETLAQMPSTPTQIRHFANILNKR